MRHSALTLLIGTLIALPLAFCKADLVTVVVDFEEYADRIGDNTNWSNSFPSEFDGFKDSRTVQGPYGSVQEISYESGGVTFYAQPDNYWQGTGLSTKTSKTSGEWYADGNDLLSATNSGNNGSKTYAVVYGDSTVGLTLDSGRFPRISLPTGALLQSIAITNTGYAFNSLTESDLSGFSTPLSQNGDFFNLIIYGLNGGDLLGSKTVSLGQFLDGTASVLSDWMTVDLTDLSGAEELRFAFNGSDKFEYEENVWLSQPVYFAFDDLTYLIDNGHSSSSAPEPATMLIFGLGIAGLALRRKK